MDSYVYLASAYVHYYYIIACTRPNICIDIDIVCYYVQAVNGILEDSKWLICYIYFVVQLIEASELDSSHQTMDSDLIDLGSAIPGKESVKTCSRHCSSSPESGNLSLGTSKPLKVELHNIKGLFLIVNTCNA